MGLRQGEGGVGEAPPAAMPPHSERQSEEARPAAAVVIKLYCDLFGSILFVPPADMKYLTFLAGKNASCGLEDRIALRFR